MANKGVKLLKGQPDLAVTQVNARSRESSEQGIDHGPAGTLRSLGGRGLVKSTSTLLWTLWSGASSAIAISPNGAAAGPDNWRCSAINGWMDPLLWGQDVSHIFGARRDGQRGPYVGTEDAKKRCGGALAVGGPLLLPPRTHSPQKWCLFNNVQMQSVDEKIVSVQPGPGRNQISHSTRGFGEN